MHSSSLPSISVKELALRLAENDGNHSLQLIDVRELQEAEFAFIQGFKLFPLSSFEQWSKNIISKYNSKVETLVLCHHGMRSAHMCQWLLNQGFTNVKNIEGGIDAYSQLVDSSIPRY